MIFGGVEKGWVRGGGVVGGERNKTVPPTSHKIHDKDKVPQNLYFDIS